MGMKLSEIEEGKVIVLLVSNKNNSMVFEATVKKPIKNNISLISIEHPSNQRLSFENVQIDIEYSADNDVPFIWHGAKILPYQEDYVIQVASDGVKHNRRESFRIPVATSGVARIAGKGSQLVMVKDISITGFSITDRKKELNLSLGERISVSFEDLAYKLDLTGSLVRIEEREEMIIYGFEISNLCKNLSPYISEKQRLGRRQK